MFPEKEDEADHRAVSEISGRDEEGQSHAPVSLSMGSLGVWVGRTAASSLSVSSMKPELAT